MGGKKIWLTAIVAVAVVLIIIAVANSMPQQASSDEKVIAAEETATKSSVAGDWSETTRKACLTCHAVDENGKAARISDIRKSPEAWEQTIYRMQTTWGVELTNEEAQAIVKELSMKNGLAPEETDKIMYWLADTGSTMEPAMENELMQESCIQCHAGAKPLGQYRTAEDWSKIKDFHIGMNPSMVYQMRAIDWPGNADKIAAYLAETNPLETEAWTKWKNEGKIYDISGDWKIVGYSPSAGFYTGDATISANDDRFYEKKTITPRGEAVSYEGNVNLFTGYSIRSSLGNENEKIRGVFNVKKDGKTIEGQWNQVHDSGIYGKETYYKKDGTQLVAVWPEVIQKGSEQTITIIGTNLPDGLNADNLQATEGLQVIDVKQTSNDELQVKVKAAPNSNATKYDISLAGQEGVVSLNAYEKIDFVKVTPEFGVARVAYDGRKQSVQFEAIAFANGQDGKPNTEDDIEIGPVPAKWKLTEYKFMGMEDDDIEYVGEINEDTGLFIPREGGPNTNRVWDTNNTGNVNVVATYTNPATGKEIVGETFLLITIPDFVYVK